ncbi:MAG: hypothetical protein JWN80_2154 [Microbacteriaceae bacterium]|nr:hypothetical protein [Microbacteriaceae bacterium]
MMSFSDAVVACVRKYAEFTGRATRPEFWWFLLFTVVVGSALGALNFSTPGGVFAIGTTLASVWSIITLVPSLAVAVRRLRDAGRSWAELFWILLPIAGIIVLIIRWCEPSKPGSSEPA